MPGLVRMRSTSAFERAPCFVGTASCRRTRGRWCCVAQCGPRLPAPGPRLLRASWPRARDPPGVPKAASVGFKFSAFVPGDSSQGRHGALGRRKRPSARAFRSVQSGASREGEAGSSWPRGRSPCALAPGRRPRGQRGWDPWLLCVLRPVFVCLSACLSSTCGDR